MAEGLDYFYIFLIIKLALYNQARMLEGVKFFLIGRKGDSYVGSQQTTR